jgi:hypothetical protein
VLKAILYDSPGGTYLGGHVAKLDSDGKATETIVPFIGRLAHGTNTPDIVQVIDAQDNVEPYYSIDILEANVASKKIIGLAVPRSSDLSLSNKGQMMVVIMNIDKDNIEVLIAGFRGTTSGKGHLYRRPFGIFDIGEHLSFAFVASPTLTD